MSSRVWRRVSLKCAEGTLHGLLSFILQGLSQLNIYIPCSPAIVSSLLTTPFIGVQEKDWQGEKTLPPFLNLQDLIRIVAEEAETELSGKPILLHLGSISVVFLLKYIVLTFIHPQFLYVKRAGFWVIR